MLTLLAWTVFALSPTQQKTVETQIKFQDDTSTERSHESPIAKTPVGKSLIMNEEDDNASSASTTQLAHVADTETHEETPPQPSTSHPQDVSPPSASAKPPGSAVKEKIQKFQQVSFRSRKYVIWRQTSMPTYPPTYLGGVISLTPHILTSGSIQSFRPSSPDSHLISSDGVE